MKKFKLSNYERTYRKDNAEFEAFSTEAIQQSEKGNKAAGTRARKSALELSKLFKDFRKVSVEESKK
nr:histone H1 [Chryseobacterium soldanellicola]